MTDVRLAFIGAGAVNFGGGEGPWDHADRFERIEGVRCAGVADLDAGRAEAVLRARRQGPRGDAWKDARAFGDWRHMVEELRPDAVVIGLPPDAHGRTDPPGDVELTLARRGIAMLVEKPLGIVDPSEAQALAEQLDRCGAVVSVGYMFRYAGAVRRMRDLLAEAPGGVRVFLARYDCAYSEIRKAGWWDTARSGGPIIEQATHLVDLARWLCGEARPETVQVKVIAGPHEKNRLSDIPRDEGGRRIDADVPKARRIPRATLAQWRFADGAIGSLAHGVLLHRKRYEAELEVWADGLRCVLRDPYGACRLGVRRPGCEETEWTAYDDDPYLAEDRAFIEAVRSGSTAPILSSYPDALRTHRLTWTIAERSK